MSLALRAGRRVLRSGVTSLRAYRISPSQELTKYGKGLFVTTAPFDLAANSRTYQGVSSLGGVDAISENSRGQSTRVELSLSGVRTDFVSTAMRTAYKDRPCIIYAVAFDQNGQLLGTPITLFRGRIDSMPISVGDTATISVIVESELVSWERQHTRRYNDASQQILYPGDKGMEFVWEMVDKDVWWPDKFSAETVQS